MVRLFLLTCACLATFSHLSFGQVNDHVMGEILVQSNNETDVLRLVDHLNQEGRKVEIEREVSAPFGIWLLRFDFVKMDENFLLRKIKKHPSVLNAQFNHFVEKRSTIPDDPLFTQQWYWQNVGQNGGTPDADVDADLAWDITTGGTTLDGDEIVVCVIEGANRNHPDLQGNLWVNSSEIPDDDIDNDGNGYVDDYEGWNVNALSDFINPDQHGTAVSGVIGARGDNGIYLSGMNWEVKIMHVDFSNSVESDIVAAYTYPLLMRRMFNESNGEKGALIVSTNASWGIDGANPDNFPIWCAIYDTLGKEGILNCVATSNDGVNVDDVGDMPGNCPSEYIINVTATDQNDWRNFAGYGTTHVDLAAPGENMTLLNLNGGPLNDSGTSYATPIVSGLVALLYSAPCSSIGKRAIADPESMAVLARDAILEGVDIRPNLLDEVKTGGRVNALHSLQLLLEKCTRCEPPFGLGVDSVGSESARVFWTSTDSTLNTDLRWRNALNPTWDTLENVSNHFLWTGLDTCTVYEFQLEDMCQDTVSGYSESFYFETDGCCRAPGNISIFDISINGMAISWDSVLAAQTYNLILTTPIGPVTFEGLNGTAFNLENLSPCTEYTVQIEIVCQGGGTDVSPPVLFTTIGCGTCLDTEYCPSKSEDATGEWIANVSINNLDNTSLSDNGYGNYTNLSADLVTWQNYSISITPGFNNFEYAEWFTVWIDFDQDGAFDGAGEEVFNSNGTSTSTVVGNILIPGDAQLGSTRMRVAMRFNVAPEACDEFFSFGEVEDYCVNILPGSEPDCYPPQGLNVSVIGNTFADLSWNETPDAIAYEMRIRPLSLPIWTVISTTANEVTALNLEVCQLHQFQIRSVCVDEKSLWSPSANFMTGCFVPTNEKEPVFFDLEIYPNPFDDGLWVSFQTLEPGEVFFEMTDVTGKSVFRKSDWATSGRPSFRLDFDKGKLPSGMYFLSLKNEHGEVVRKVLK